MINKMANYAHGREHKYGYVVGSFIDGVISFIATIICLCFVGAIKDVITAFLFIFILLACISSSVLGFAFFVYHLNFGSGRKGKIKCSYNMKPSHNYSLSKKVSLIIYISGGTLLVSIVGAIIFLSQLK